jgi:hypothetical protein
MFADVDVSGWGKTKWIASASRSLSVRSRSRMYLEKIYGFRNVSRHRLENP